MSARLFTTDELITVLRDYGSIPPSGATGSEDSDLRVRLWDAMMEQIVPRLMASREGYFLQRDRTALTTTCRYRIPHRAMYGRLENVWYLGSDDKRSTLAKVDPRLRSYQQTATSIPTAFYIEGDWIVLMPESDSPSFEGYLEMSYFMRPGELVLTSAAGVIDSVTTATKTITCTADVSGLFSEGDLIDVHSPHSGADLKEWDLTVSSVTTTDIVVSEEIDGTTFGRKAIAAGDYVCLAETAVLPALPRELHPLVARAAALEFAESIGDSAQVQLHGSLLEKQLSHILGVTADRVEAQPVVFGASGWM